MKNLKTFKCAGIAVINKLPQIIYKDYRATDKQNATVGFNQYLEKISDKGVELSPTVTMVFQAK